MQPADYSDFIRVMVKCLKDANIYVVTLACNLICAMGDGLRGDFHKYINALVRPLLERTKEKKPSVVEALENALDICFKYSSLDEILEPTLEHMKHKTPQIRIESLKYLVRCLKATKVIPGKDDVNSIVQISIKLLSDAQAPVRTGASEVLGTLMKIIGERPFKPFLEKVDNRHIKKIEEFYGKAEISAKPKMAVPPKSTKAPAPRKAPHRLGRPDGPKPPSPQFRRGAPPVRAVSANTTPSLPRPDSKSPTSNSSPRSPLPKHPPVGKRATGTTGRSSQATGKRPSDIGVSKYAPPSALSSIPSKRGPSSPLKGSTTNTKMNLTSKPLKPVNSPAFSEPQMTSAEKQELETLRAEKAAWLIEKERLQANLKNQTEISEKYLSDLSAAQAQREEYLSRFTNLNLTVKSKETQLYRLQGDLENAKNKILSLEQRLHQTQQLNQSMINNGGVSSVSPSRSNFGNGDSTNHELSRRISDMSIHSDSGKENVLDTSASKFTPDIYDLNNTDDSWKKAAEVTNQLKARIEEMKARTRTLNPL
ncbi:unnamed protein product [Ambrosiozyma monospora]|uniref:Unnamed protein product n=1 Tax=Ambrosiozyma monospora TaxID=43982 RepID=A0ACB5T5I9_AMBMO|nr:unnamed protein product [Ambrosiozyma monospora]